MWQCGSFLYGHLSSARSGTPATLHVLSRHTTGLGFALHAKQKTRTTQRSLQKLQAHTGSYKHDRTASARAERSGSPASQRLQALDKEIAGSGQKQSADEAPNASTTSTAHSQPSGESLAAERSSSAESPSSRSSVTSSNQMVDLQHSRLPNPLLGELSLFLVAAFWGTNPVCLRYVYMLQQPPSPSMLAAIQALGGALLLTAVSVAGSQELWKASNGGGSHGLGAPGGEPASLWKKLQGQARKDSVTRAGLEVGLWTFLANAATISAFEHTPASRGAFLIRLTAVFTPVVSYLSGQSPSKREWGACAMALLGGLLISFDTWLESSASNGDAALGIGDVVMILSAFLWAVQTVRLGKHAALHAPATLARNQAAMLALCSALWLATDVSLTGPGESPVGSLAFGSGWLIWAAVLWPAIGPWGIGTALQVRAQGTVTPSRTQIILATDPLWATAFAGLLGSAEQHLGGYGWLGAACVIGASVVSRH